VYLGGLAYINGNGVTESNAAAGVFEMNASLAPMSDDNFYVTYNVGTISTGSNSISSGSYRNYVDSTNNGLVGLQNGSNTVYTVSQQAYLEGSVLAFLSGQPLSNGNGITETNAAAGTITFDIAPLSSDIIIIQYSK
jgi:hypothetical protein